VVAISLGFLASSILCEGSSVISEKLGEIGVVGSRATLMLHI